MCTLSREFAGILIWDIHMWKFDEVYLFSAPFNVDQSMTSIRDFSRGRPSWFGREIPRNNAFKYFHSNPRYKKQNIAYTHVYIILIFFTEDENRPKLKLRQPRWAPKGKIHHKSGHSFHFRSFQTWKWFTISLLNCFQTTVLKSLRMEKEVDMICTSCMLDICAMLPKIKTSGQKFYDQGGFFGRSCHLHCQGVDPK